MKKLLWVLGLVTLTLTISSAPTWSSQEETEDLSHRGIFEEHWKELDAKNGTAKPKSEQIQEKSAPLKKHAWEFGSEIFYKTYEEPGVMKEKGFMYGIFSSYTYRNWPYQKTGNVMLRGEGRFDYGQLDYSGSGTLDNIPDYLLEFRGLGGYDFLIEKSTTLTPYIGFGYRYLNDDSSGMSTSTGARGYERESNYFYSPIGIETFTELENGWSIGAATEYDIFWKGIQKSHLSDAVAGLSDVENDQNSGYGVRGSIKIQKKSRNVDYIIEPFITYWNIKESEITAITFSGTIVDFGFEPANHTTEYGLKIAAKF